MKLTELECIIEAILFAAGEAVPLKNISSAIGHDVPTTKKIISSLNDKYCAEKRGIRLLRVGEAFQMCTNPDYFSYINTLVSLPSQKSLTPTVLETLAIIAYKQPVTKSDIEEIRGVDATHAVNRLMEYNLVQEKGRKDAPGRPILFGTTDEFLRHFGFGSLGSLPALE